jgi:hypothetical protein
LVGHSFADSVNLEKALEEIENNKDLSSKAKHKLKRLIFRDWYLEQSVERRAESKKQFEEENDIWGLLNKNSYVVALKKIVEARYIRAKRKYMLERVINLEKEISLTKPKNKVEALELTTKKLQLKLLSLEMDLENLKDNLELEMLDINYSLESKGIDLDELKEKLEK